MLNDIRFAIRMVLTHPWFSVTVVVTLALCIGVNTTVFTLVDAALLKPVPVPRGKRLVAISERDPKNPQDRRGISLPKYLEYRSQARTLAAIGATAAQQGIISEEANPPERYNMSYITTDLFEMLRTLPILGRPFGPSDGIKGAAPVALIGYKVWQKRYGGAPDAVGRSVTLNGVVTTLVGVMPDGFKFPGNEEIWAPIVTSQERDDRTHRDLRVFAILAPGTTIADAQSDLEVISARIAKAFPASDKDATPLVQTFQEAFNGGPIKLVLLLMQGAVGFVLLIGCANVANMMLSRALARVREIALRAAIGASRWRIIRQLLVESVLLSVLGGLGGLVLSQFGVHAFDLATRDVGKPYWVVFTMDWRAFLYFGSISLGTGLIFGIVPAWWASSVDLNAALKEGTAGAGLRTGRLTGTLVVFQFALTVILLAGAGVMARSFIEAQRLNAFVPADHILTARVSLPDGKGERYESVASRRRMHALVRETLESLPGVKEAALASDMPGLGAGTRDIELEGRPTPDPKKPHRATAVFASPNYLAAIGLPIQLGRGLNETDGDEGKEASVVTRAFAAEYWPGESPIGRRFRFLSDGKPGSWITVVGVCGNVVQDSTTRNPPPLAYFSDRQEPWAWMGILIRAAGDPSSLAASVQAAFQRIDPNLPVFDVRTLPMAIERQFWYLEVFGTLFLAFALIALLMASVGIYAVVAQSTSRRTREIGIRMALGASAQRVVRLVLARGLKQLAIGLALGLAGAVAATRLMEAMPGLKSTRDPVVFCSIAVALFSIGFFACWLPARRAASIAPTEALRTD